MAVTAAHLVLEWVVSKEDTRNRRKSLAAVLEKQVERICLPIAMLDQPLEGGPQSIARSRNILIANCDVGRKRAQRGAEDRFDPAHNGRIVELEIRPDCHRIAQTVADKAAERQLVGIVRATIPERSDHPAVEAKLGQPGGELGLIEKDVEAQHLGAAGIVQHIEANVVGPLGKGEIAQVVVARRELEPPDLLAIDDHFHSRRPIKPESPITARADDLLWAQHAVIARKADAGDVRGRLEPARLGFQISDCHADQVADIVEHHAAADPLEILRGAAGDVNRVAFDYELAHPGCAIEQEDRIAETGVRAVLNQIERTANVDIGAERLRFDVIADLHPIERGDRQAARGAALDRDLEPQLQRARIVIDRDPGSSEIAGADLRLAGKTAAQRS